MLTRRQLIKNTGLLAALQPLRRLKINQGNRFMIGACDWSLGKRTDLDAFDVAKQIGLDGIMVDMGTPEDDLRLRDPSLQKKYLETSKQTGIRISSIAIGALNDVPYKSDPKTVSWVLDSIDVAQHLGVPVILLAFFNKNDLRNDQEGKAEVIRRLKEAAPKAEKANVILGIESYLNAKEHFEMMNKIGSPNVKAYIDFRNTADAGYDPVEEIKQLGKDNICELHMKENGFLLGEGTLDWKNIARTLHDMNYRGDRWMQIEWAMPKDADVVESYKHNVAFLRKLFKA